MPSRSSPTSASIWQPPCAANKPGSLGRHLKKRLSRSLLWVGIKAERLAIRAWNPWSDIDLFEFRAPLNIEYDVKTTSQ